MLVFEGRGSMRSALGVFYCVEGLCVWEDYDFCL